MAAVDPLVPLEEATTMETLLSAACLVPARRASRTDPVTTIRAE